MKCSDGDGTRIDYAVHGHRNVSIRCRTVAELTLSVLSPALDGAATDQCAGVGTTCCDCRGVGNSGDGRRDVPVRLGGVGPRPALNSSRSSEDAGSAIPRGDGCHIGETRDCCGWQRRSATGQQIGPGVVSPADDGARAGDRARGKHVSSDSCDAGEAHRGDRCMTFGVRAVSELSVVVFSPALDGAGVRERAGVIASRSDGNRIAQTANRHRGVPILAGSVTQLPDVVLAPAFDLMRGGNRAGVVIAGCHLGGPGDLRSRRDDSSLGDQTGVAMVVVGHPGGDNAVRPLGSGCAGFEGVSASFRGLGRCYLLPSTADRGLEDHCATERGSHPASHGECRFAHGFLRGCLWCGNRCGGRRRSCESGEKPKAHCY